MRIMMKKKGLGAPVVEPAVTGDPYWDNVVLLIDGEDTIRDLKGHSLVTYGDAQISTSRKKFGASSMKFDGVGDDKVRLDASPDFLLGPNDDFTIEAFVNQTSLGQQYPRIIQGGDNMTSGAWGLLAGHSSWSSANFVLEKGGYNPNPFLMSTTDIANNVWYHVAVTRQGNTFRMFVDGQLEDTATDSTAMCIFETLNIGGLGGAHEYFNGHIDEVRITKGIARYTENFTPPTEAFPNTRGPLPGEDLRTLDSFGPLNGISKVETNGLTDGSYTTSSIYPGFIHVAGGWDGYKYNPADAASGIPVFDGITPTNAPRGRGYANSDSGQTTNQWWAVDMGKEVVVDSFCLYGYNVTGAPNLHPKNIRFEISDDGITWTSVLTDVNANWPADDVSRGSFHVLGAPVTSRHFRYFAVDNYGSTGLIVFSYLELYSPPDKTKTYTAIGNVQVGQAATMVSNSGAFAGFYTLKEALQDTTVFNSYPGPYGPSNFISRYAHGDTPGASYTEVLDAGVNKQFVVGDITVQPHQDHPGGTDPFEIFVSDDNVSWTSAGQLLTEVLGQGNDDVTVPLNGTGRYMKLVSTPVDSGYARFMMSHCTQWNIRIQEVN